MHNFVKNGLQTGDKFHNHFSRLTIVIQTKLVSNVKLRKNRTQCESAQIIDYIHFHWVRLMRSSTFETGINVFSEYYTRKTSLYKNNLSQNNSTLFHHAKSASRCLWKTMMSVWDIDKTKNLITYGLKTNQTVRSVACLSETCDLLFTQQVGILDKEIIFFTSGSWYSS